MGLKEMSFEVIQKCPNNCIYCSSNSTRMSEHIIEYEVYERVIKDAFEIGLRDLAISGGEPFQHPDLIRMVEFAKNKGLNVNIYTSGIVELENDKKVEIDDNTLEKLKSLGVNKLIFNVQASNEKLYNNIMQTEGCFDKMIKSIKKAVDRGIYSEIHFVPMKLNYKDIYTVLKELRKLNVQKISFLKLVIQGRALDNRARVELTDEENKELIQTLKEIGNSYEGIEVRTGIPFSDRNQEKKCNAGNGKIIVRYDGAVYPCEAFKYIDSISSKGTKIKPDNIKELGFAEIYIRSEFLKILRESVLEFQKIESTCESCCAQWIIKELRNK